MTKLLTALTVLDLAAEGILDLDEPAGPPGTVRHLLAHASGLAAGGERILAPPGRRRIYSNSGIEKAAQLAALRAGRAFPLLLTERVLDRVGMSGTVLAGSPAHGVAGPVSDLARLAHELVSPRRLDRRLIAAATVVTFPGLSGVLPGFGRQEPNDWGLGFELRGTKSPHWTPPEASPRTFGHVGQRGTFLWVDPDRLVACVAAGGKPFGPWTAEAWPRFGTRLLRVLSADGVS